MAKAPTLTDITNIENAASILNANWDAIQTAFQNTVSRDGSTPNQMEADLDMNSNDLLNVATMDVGSLTLNGVSLTSSTVADLAPFNSVSEMIASTSISVGNYVSTLGYERPGDGGAAIYKIVATGTGTDDGGSYHDLTGITGQAELQHGKQIKAEWWGVVLDASGNPQEKSAEWQAAMYYATDLAPSSRQDTEPAVIFTCYSGFKTKNILHITKSGGGRAAFMEIIHPAKIELDDVSWDAGTGTLANYTGGNTPETHPLPIINMRCQVSRSYWGEVDCKHRSAGVRYWGCSRHFQHYMDLHSFRKYGHLVLNASNGNLRIIDNNCKQWLLDDTGSYSETPGGTIITGGADNPANYDGDCYVACYKDHLVTGGTFGWSKSAILLLSQTGDWSNTSGKDIYPCGLVQASDPFYHAAGYVTSNGSGDCIIQNVHVMQGFGSISAAPRIDNIENGGPASIVCYNLTNKAYVWNADIDASTVQLYGDSIELRNCSFISGGTNKQSDRVVVWDPRIRVHRNPGGLNFGNLHISGITNASIGFYDSAEGTVSGDYQPWNALNQPGGGVYTGPLAWGDFWNASGGNGTCPTVGVSAGDVYIVSVAGTVDGEIFAEGDYLIARVNSPGGTYNSTNWHHTTYSDVYSRSNSREPIAILPRVHVVPRNQTIPYQEWYKSGNTLKEKWDIAGSTAERKWDGTDLVFTIGVTDTFTVSDGVVKANSVLQHQNWKLNYDGEELTIATGSITPTGDYHTVDTEANAATDDLDTIAAANAHRGSRLVLRTADSTRAVVIKNGIGNIICGADITMSTTNHIVELIRAGTSWIVVSSRAN